MPNSLNPSPKTYDNMTTPKDTSAAIHRRSVNTSGASVCTQCGTGIAHRRTNVQFCKSQCSKGFWRLKNPEVDKACQETWRKRVMAQEAKTKLWPKCNSQLPIDQPIPLSWLALLFSHSSTCLIWRYGRLGHEYVTGPKACGTFRWPRPINRPTAQRWPQC